MNLIQLKPEEIVVTERQRVGYPNVGDLADSLSEYGLIEPLVVSLQDEKYVLVAGGRRLTAVKELKWEQVACVVREQLSDVEKAELELEENIQREALPWQDHCMAIADIHERHVRTSALKSEKWGLQHTGALLGLKLTNVAYAIRVAELLRKNDKTTWAMSSMWSALQDITARKAAEVSRFVTRTPTPKVKKPEGVDLEDWNEDDEPIEAVVLSDSPPGDPGAKYGRSLRLVLDDSMEWLERQPDESIDHIYTDPPYGIDMENIQQAGVGMNVETVKEEHEVAPNLQLLTQFLGLAYQKTRTTAFVVFWCDQDNWQFLKDTAEGFGFRVQRWPLVWIKTHPCQNTQAFKNFTKSTEIAMLCAKPQATLAQTRRENYWIGSTIKGEPDDTHPFWKPVELHKWVLRAIAVTEATIVDPFAGAGSIPLACVRATFNAIGIEKVPHHYAMMQSNFKDKVPEITPEETAKGT